LDQDIQGLSNAVAAAKLGMTMTNKGPDQPGFAGIDTAREKPGSRKKFWLLGLGFLVPVVLAGVLLWLNRPEGGLANLPNKLGLDSWQSANLDVLTAEIENLKKGLTQPPCAMPPLSNFGPGRSDGSTGQEASEAKPPAGLEAGLSARPAESPDQETPGAKPLAGQESGDPSQPAEGESTADLVERATVMVLVDAPGELVQGTGFFITPKVILTNRHVIEALRRRKPEARALVASKALGQAVEARLLWSTGPDQLRDYAFLEINPPAGGHPAVLALAGEVKRADHIGSWGYPVLLTKTDPQTVALFSGQLSAVPEGVYSEGVVSVLQDVDGVPIINHTAEVSHGSSGGPLVNARGEVVGINTLIRLDEQSNRQVNIALGSRDILKCAAEQGLFLTGY